jgi:hypothetical protein
LRRGLRELLSLRPSLLLKRIHIRGQRDHHATGNQRANSLPSCTQAVGHLDFSTDFEESGRMSVSQHKLGDAARALALPDNNNP